MDKKAEESELIVNGFAFTNVQEAQEALKESQKIQYLETKIDYGDLRKVQAIYEKAVNENVFHTVTGLFYLKGIRDFLVREDERYETVLPRVPAPVTGSAKTRTAQAKRKEKQELQLEEKKTQLKVSVLVNILLVGAIVAMFIITLNSEQPNILNYEKAITNRYASWEQQLTQREQAVRQRELEILREE